MFTSEHVLRKIHHCTFDRNISGRPFYLSKILMTFFSHRPFYRFLPFRLLQMTPITYSLHPFTPSIHPHMLFFTFLHLALCSRNNRYSMRHLFLFSSSLHKRPFITAHFRSSLHTKASPGNNLVNIVGLQLVSK